MCALFPQVAAYFNVSRQTIIALMAKFVQTGTVDDLPRAPKPRSTTPAQDNQIHNVHLQNRRLRAAQTARTLIGPNGRQIHPKTVLNRLREQGLRSRRPYRGLILTPQHRRLRLQWARRHLRWTRVDWATVLFTDESSFNVYENDGRMRVFRVRNERFRDNCVIETNRFGGGSVMIWGGISLNTKSNCVVIYGNLNAIRYQQEILIPECIPHIRATRGMRLMQDGAPCHTARATMGLLANQRINVLPWPALSPDLNPIEHIWDVIGRNVRERNCRTVQELERAVVQEWNNVGQNICRSYVASMRQRCLAVINAAGGHTRY